ncbi:Hpt domain-containing protein [uncultured Campylobacter sp.]|uniref:Hpt domain-containing protein n=1 Tax=uncultured Campylobacter sp. TaxID=218934 RepID=UPI0026272892|nr:Hpt domain-containing protein [uncultured Campylobacter sp.]
MGILKSLEIDYSYDIVEEFLSHYTLMCDLMEPLIISLARHDRYGSNISELFRIFHNIKSAAGFMRLDPILKLTTLAEEICGEARDLQGPANEDFVDWLLLLSDQFSRYKNDIENDAEFFSPLDANIVKIPQKLDV